MVNLSREGMGSHCTIDPNLFVISKFMKFM